MMHYQHRITRYLGSISLATAFIAGVLFSSVASPAFASAITTTQNETFPTDIYAWVPCANSGNGELVHVSGPLKALFKITETYEGQFLIKTLYNPQGISGEGLTTGVIYRGTGMTQQTYIENKGIHDTFVNQFNMIGQGPNNNLSVHEDFHLTVNADGTVSAFHDNFRIECR